MTGISVRLADPALWNAFHANLTEMIVTKTGRKLFPKLEIVVSGLVPHVHYGIHMRLERADELKYRFTQSNWSSSPADDDCCFPPPPFIESNEGFAHTGSFWMSKGIEFTQFKITNNQEEKARGMILVKTLHKYVPVIYLCDMSEGYGNQQRPVLHKEVLSSAEFVTVTAYQNEAIKKLKVDHNPFAKGVRGGQAYPSTRKRSYSPTRSGGGGDLPSMMGHRSAEGAPPPAKMESPAFPSVAAMRLSPAFPPPAVPMPSPAFPALPPTFPTGSMSSEAHNHLSPSYPFPSPPQDKDSPPATVPLLSAPFDFHHMPLPYPGGAMEGAVPMNPYSPMMFPGYPFFPMDYSAMFAHQHQQQQQHLQQMQQSPFFYPSVPQPPQLDTSNGSDTTITSL